MLELRPSNKHSIIDDAESWLTAELDDLLPGDTIVIEHRSPSGLALDSMTFTASR